MISSMISGGVVARNKFTPPLLADRTREVLVDGDRSACGLVPLYKRPSLGASASLFPEKKDHDYPKQLK